MDRGMFAEASLKIAVEHLESAPFFSRPHLGALGNSAADLVTPREVV
jgi:hypothetical protein